jgi:hypothetical protein
MKYKYRQSQIYARDAILLHASTKRNPQLRILHGKTFKPDRIDANRKDMSSKMLISEAKTLILSIYGSTALYWILTAFSVSSSFTQSVGLLGRGISPSRGRYLHTGQHKHNKGHTYINTLSGIGTHEPSV